MAETPPMSPEFAAEDKGPAIIVSMSALSGLATLFVAARLFVRSRILGKMHWDDYIITVALLLGWVYSAMTIIGVQHGDGKHSAVLTEKQRADAHFWTILGWAPGIMSFGLPKLAVVSLLTRLLNPGKVHWYFLWTIAILTQAILIVNIALVYTQCLPTASMWDTSITEKYCRDGLVLVVYALLAGCFSAAVDLYLAVYPAVVLFHLQMAMRKKIGLSIALGFGSIAAIVAIYKCTRVPSLASPDFSYDTADLVIWTSIECNTLVIASCIPILQPLIDRLKGKHRRSQQGPAGRYSPYNPGNRLMAGPTAMEMSFACRGKTRRDIESFSEIEADKGTSQDSIMGPPSPRDTYPPPSDGIMRTKVITISYDDRRPESSNSQLKSHPAQWRPRRF